MKLQPRASTRGEARRARVNSIVLLEWGGHVRKNRVRANMTETPMPCHDTRPHYLNRLDLESPPTNLDSIQHTTTHCNVRRQQHPRADLDGDAAVSRVLILLLLPSRGWASGGRHRHRRSASTSLRPIPLHFNLVAYASPHPALHIARSSLQRRLA